MFKLLSTAGLEKVEREYNLRRLGVALSLLLTLIIFAVVSIMPALFLAQAKRESATLYLSTASQLPKEERDSIEEWLTDVKIKLSTVVPYVSVVNPSELFKTIISSKNAGVKIKSFDFDSEHLMVKVSGRALDRQTLLAFQATLKASLKWERVELPVDVLAKDTDIDFVITLTPKSS